VADQALSQDPRFRIIVLFSLLWLVVVGLSYLFVLMVFDLDSDQVETFSLSFFAIQIGSWALSVFVLRSVVSGLETFRSALSNDDRLSGASFDQVASSASKVFSRLGLLGLAWPILSISGAGLATVTLTNLGWSYLGYFVVLSLFDGVFTGAVLFQTPRRWLSPLMEKIASVYGDIFSGNGLSLKAKLIFLSFILATVPTLLVGSMSYLSANSLLRSAGGSAASGLVWMIIGIMLCSMGVAIIVGTSFAANLGANVQRMSRLANEMAQGRLKSEVRVISDDEIGVLGQGLFSLTENLRRMVRGVSVLAQHISTTCNQLLVKASAISTGAEIQSRSVDETYTSVEELNSNIQAAAESLDLLTKAMQETTEATNKMATSFSVITDKAKSLETTAEKTGSVVESMVASVIQVAGDIRQLSDGAGRSAKSMQEIDRSITEVTSSAADTAGFAREAIDSAQDGAVAVRRTIEGMDRIAESAHQALEVIMGLGMKVEDIGGILEVIEEIADQTNLLALNAAIIAAQAGEHGRSFAVVADEIRSLAERTASSTREIAQMIADIQETSKEASSVMNGSVNLVNDGVSLAKQAGNSLNLILVSIQKAADNVEAIAVKARQQAKSSESVTTDIAHVAQMADRISSASVSQIKAGEQLSEAFSKTLSMSSILNEQVSQQAQESRQALAAISASNDAAARASKAIRDQSNISSGIVYAIEQIREIAKNHAMAASEMGESTKVLADESSKLKEEIGEFKV